VTRLRAVQGACLPGRAVLAVLAVLAGTDRTWAQQPSADGDPLPITVSAKPVTVLLGSKVTFAGSSIATPTLSSVRLTAKPSSGGTPAPVELQASLNASGEFSSTYTPMAAGTYQVVATAVDGRGQATASFKVQDAASLDAGLTSAIPGAVTDVTQITTAIKPQIQALPPNPVKDDLLQKFQALDQPLADLQSQANRVAPALNQLIRISGHYQLTDKLRAERDRLIDGLGQVQRARDEARNVLARVGHAHTRCDDLEVVTEGIKFNGVLLNLVSGDVWSMAMNFVQDFDAAAAAGGMKSIGGSDAGQFGAQEVVQAVTLLKPARGGFSVSANGVVGRLNDVAGVLAGQAMAKYCVEFGGPVKAHMQAHFFKDGIEWWQYSFDLIGKLTLHYPRDAQGDDIPVSGRLEGYGTNFKATDNALNVLYPQLMSSAVQKKIHIPPPYMPATADGSLPFQYSAEGSVFGAAVTPNAFFFETKGVLQKDRLVFNVGAVRVDQSPVEHVIVLFVSPLSLSYATFLPYALPYKDAHFVFERAADSTFDIPLSTQGKVVRGQRHFQNRRDNAEAKGEYSVDVTVCNPGC
jgi:hypothetical protein